MQEPFTPTKPGQITSPEKQRKNQILTNRIFSIFSLCVTAAVFYYLFSFISLAELLETLRSISIPGLFAFILCSFTMSFFRTWRYELLLGVTQYRVHRIALFLVTLVRNFFSDLLPARLGTLVYIYLVQGRLGIPFGPAASSFALAFLFDIIALALVAIPMAILISSSLLSTPILVFSGCLLLGISGLILLILPTILLSCASFVGKLRKIIPGFSTRIQKALIETGESILETKRGGIYLKVITLSLGVRFFKYLALYILLLALLVPAKHEAMFFPLPKVFIGLLSAEMAASLPISSIAGFGAYEGTWALVFQLLGYPEKMAVLSGISHHLITQIWGYSIGIVALFFLWLPVFQYRTQTLSDTPVNQPRKKTFWIVFLTTFTLSLLLLQQIFPESRSQLGSNQSMTEKLERSATSTMLQGEIQTLLKGKLIYQRPDGIYKMEIGTSREQQLTTYGTCPRWSPDGKNIAFVYGNDIMLMHENGSKINKLAKATKAKALCFHPHGKEVLFTDGRTIKSVNIADKRVVTVAHGHEFLELDVDSNGLKLAVTTRSRFGGFQVRLINLQKNDEKIVGKGCSASLSPNNQYVTVNTSDHTELTLYSQKSLKPVGIITAPPGEKFDNQFWSNHPDWLVSRTETGSQNIFAHHIPTNGAFQLTGKGKADRPDLFVLWSK